jgi:AcrR family transcriptional regulator
MARRSDHTRPELENLILEEGHRLMAEVGYPRFSAREVAKRIGYSVGTIHNVCGDHDRLVLAINARTFSLWTGMIAARLDANPPDRIAVLVDAYFAFAAAHPNLWLALYEHRILAPDALPEAYRMERSRLLSLIGQEIAAVLPKERAARAAPLARSLLATVHGHCLFTLLGTFNVLGEPDPKGAALERVREALAAACA